jgi:hypothetical protein
MKTDMKLRRDVLHKVYRERSVAVPGMGLPDMTGPRFFPAAWITYVQGGAFRRPAGLSPGRSFRQSLSFDGGEPWTKNNLIRS